MEMKVTVVGLGISGEAAALLLGGKGASVKVTENAEGPLIQKRVKALEANGIEYETGGHTEKFLEGTELMVVSPGVSGDSLAVRWAEERSVPIISEIELAYRFCRGTVIAVTGTNGKSTVVSLIGEIFKKTGKKTFVCGNIGAAFTSVVSSVNEGDIVVLEISSFQLERIKGFRARVGILLNITDDHFDRYKDLDEYTRAKFRLFENQKEDDYAVLNYEQPRLKSAGGSIRSRVYYFCKHRLPKEYNGAYVENNGLLVRVHGKFVWVGNRDELSLKGEHNLENSLAAALGSFLMGASPDSIKDVLYSFKGLDHRFEFVDMIDGIKFVDDSKATNVDSVRRAIQSSHKGIILIAGGRDKGGDYKILTKVLKEKTKEMILIGEAREKIARELADTVPISFAQTLDEAVRLGFGRAKRGDTVLLSPMCSSFDMFTDYKERGMVFCKAVESLKKDA